MNDKDLIGNLLTALDLGALRPGGISAHLCGRLGDIVRQGQAEQRDSYASFVQVGEPCPFIETVLSTSQGATMKFEASADGYSWRDVPPDGVLYITKTGTCSSRPPLVSSQREPDDEYDPWESSYGGDEE